MSCVNTQRTAFVRLMLAVSTLAFRFAALSIVMIYLALIGTSPGLFLLFVENAFVTLWLLTITGYWVHSWPQVTVVGDNGHLLLLHYHNVTRLVSSTAAFVAMSTPNVDTTTMACHLLCDFLSNALLPYIDVDMNSNRRTNTFIFNMRTPKRQVKDSDSDRDVEMQVVALRE
jgi:hypothetical protein